MKIGIVGSGASGMMAAITAAEQQEHEVILFERQARVGRKLLATGNGRCNLSNRQLSMSFYHGTAPSFAAPALSAFTPEDTVEFFHGIGLLTVSEPSGRIYPYSDQANSVVDVLRFALNKRNINLLTDCELLSAKAQKDGFALKTAKGEQRVDRLIITTGGAAGGKLGGSKSGYQLMQALGHHCTGLHPSLVQLKTADPYVKSLKGIRANATVSLLKGESLLASSSGEVQFTDYGISGPAVFEISRAAAQAAEGCIIALDLLPQLGADELLSMLCIRISREASLPCEELLTGILHNRLGRVLLRVCGISGSTPISQLSWKAMTQLIQTVHSFCLPLSGTMGLENAQVTAGGICTAEFDAATLESLLVPGLYAAGEVLDIDGDCGGYNLQWAWSSGRLAGKLGRKHADNS